MPAEANPDPDELLRLLLQQSRDHALILLGPDGSVAAWLGGSEHVLGYTAGEMVGRPVDVIFTPVDRARGVPEHEIAVASKDGRAENDRWLVRKGGQRFWAYGVLTALRDSAGRVVGFGKVLRDRTDVRAQIEVLEHRAAALAAAARGKDAFLGTLAHELRNPLAPLANAVQIIRMMPPGGDLAVPAGIIERQAAALRRLVDDVMDVTRIGVGKMRLDLADVDVNDVLRDAVESCRPAAEARRHHVRMLLLPAAMVVRGDAGRLHQVFVNLLNNAVKYTPDGGGVWVKSTVEGGEAVVRVEDTGVGIDAAALPRIFDLFTQEEETSGRSEGGLGLGLALVKELVALHGGSVQVRSQGKGRGSEFTVRLPLAGDTNEPGATKPGPPAE